MMSSERQLPCGASFSVVTWRDKEKPWRTRTALCYCTRPEGHKGAHSNGTYTDGKDYSKK